MRSWMKSVIIGTGTALVVGAVFFALRPSGAETKPAEAGSGAQAGPAAAVADGTPAAGNFTGTRSSGANATNGRQTGAGNPAGTTSGGSGSTATPPSGGTGGAGTGTGGTGGTGGGHIHPGFPLPPVGGVVTDPGPIVRDHRHPQPPPVGNGQSGPVVRDHRGGSDSSTDNPLCKVFPKACQSH